MKTKKSENAYMMCKPRLKQLYQEVKKRKAKNMVAPLRFQNVLYRQVLAFIFHESSRTFFYMVGEARVPKGNLFIHGSMQTPHKQVLTGPGIEPTTILLRS